MNVKRIPGVLTKQSYSITVEQRDKIKAAAREKGIKASELMRALIDAFLSHNVLRLRQNI